MTVLVAVGEGIDAPCSLLSILGIRAMPISTTADKSGMVESKKSDFLFCWVTIGVDE